MLQSYPWPLVTYSSLNMLLLGSLMNDSNNLREPVGSSGLPPEVVTGNCFANNWQQKQRISLCCP